MVEIALGYQVLNQVTAVTSKGYYLPLEVIAMWYVLYFDSDE